VKLGCRVEHRDRASAEGQHRCPDQRPPSRRLTRSYKIDATGRPRPPSASAKAVHLMAGQASRQCLAPCDDPVLPSRHPPNLPHRYTLPGPATDLRPLWKTPLR
jgi:hypothetical protein